MLSKQSTLRPASDGTAREIIGFESISVGVLMKMEVRNLLKDKKVWFASFLIVWAAGLQGHMMWLKKQDSFKQKFGPLKEENDAA